jgi:nucleoside-diphosphate-sugar epimerase
VDEDHPINPSDFNGIHKRAAEQYHLLYARLGKLDSIVLRLTNNYGPRLALDVPGQGFLTVFFRRALEGDPLEVFGDGMQIRDPLYVDDAVDAFLSAGAAEAPPFRLFNICGPDALTLLAIAHIIRSESGSVSEIRLREFPEEHRAFDIGSYAGDSSRIRAALGWKPKVEFRSGVRLTLAYFRQHSLAGK